MTELSFLLISACCLGGEDATRELLNSGIDDVNPRDSRRNTPLMAVSWYDRENIVRLLLDHGANVNAQNVYGETALMNAALCGRENTVRLLLDRGADVNIRTKRGTNAAMKAALAGHESITKLLQCRMILDKVKELRYKKFKVIRIWSNLDGLYSPSSNQMFYEMGTQLKVKQSFESLKEVAPDMTGENYRFYLQGFVNGN